MIREEIVVESKRQTYQRPDHQDEKPEHAMAFEHYQLLRFEFR
jgi:hypothetical protein